MTVNDVQDQIIEEFSILGDDRESMIFYIMELGQKLPELDEKHKVEDNIIKGCQSKVWLVASMEGDKVSFHADSNTDITKGLISLLIRILSEREPQEILDSELYFISKIGMNQIIGSQRSNGFTSMIKQMKMFAIGLKAKSESNS